MKFLLALFLSSFLNVYSPAIAHDFHMSYCQAELSGKLLTGKISYFRDDFYLALKNWKGSDVSSLSKDELDKVILDYLNSTLRATVNRNQPLLLKVIAREEEGGSVMIQFQFTGGEEIHSLVIENSVLLKEFKDQSNLMLIKARSKEYNQIFDHATPTITIKF